MINLNFKLALLVTIVGCAFSFINLYQGYPESVSHLPLYKNQTLMWPAIVCSLSIILWFTHYKDNAGHFAAFIVGWYILIPAISTQISHIAYEINSRDFEKWLLFYAGFSHIIYALQNWKKVILGLGQRDG